MLFYVPGCEDFWHHYKAKNHQCAPGWYKSSPRYVSLQPLLEGQCDIDYWLGDFCQGGLVCLMSPYCYRSIKIVQRNMSSWMASCNQTIFTWGLSSCDNHLMLNPFICRSFKIESFFTMPWKQVVNFCMFTVVLLFKIYFKIFHNSVALAYL